MALHPQLETIQLLDRLQMHQLALAQEDQETTTKETEETEALRSQQSLLLQKQTAIQATWPTECAKCMDLCDQRI